MKRIWASAIVVISIDFAREMLPAENLLELFVNVENWESVGIILDYLQSPVEIAYLKNLWTEVKDICEMSVDMEYNSYKPKISREIYSAITENLGARLQDGDIILTNDGDKAYISNEWRHGGIFSKALYDGKFSCS